MIEKIVIALSLIGSVAYAQGVSMPGANFPACNANNDTTKITISDPVDDGQCGPPGLGTANPHVCVCDGTTSTWRADFPDNHELVKVDSSGNVGIGTPTAGGTVTLDLVNTSTASGSAARFKLKTSGDGDPYLQFEISAQFWAVGIDNSVGDLFSITPSSILGTSAALVIETGGDVGIGTTTPDFDFEVERTGAITLAIKSTGASNINLRLQNSGQIYTLRNTSAGVFTIVDTTSATTPFNLLAGAPSNSLVIDGDGEVGIGTGVPARALHVNDVMRLEPRATAPSSPSVGDMYVDSTTTDALCVFLNGSWVKAAGTGSCA